jgi:hypothetical protein
VTLLPWLPTALVTVVTDVTVDFVTVVSSVPWYLWLRKWQCVTAHIFSPLSGNFWCIVFQLLILAELELMEVTIKDISPYSK